MARYLVALRPNSLKHQVDILDLSFIDSSPRMVEISDAHASEIKSGISAATGKDGKAAGLKGVIIFESEAAMKGQTVEQYLVATAPLSRKQKAAKAAAAKAETVKEKSKKE
jgi:hypothetical protein